MLTTFNIPVQRMRQARVNWDIEWRGSPDQETLGGRTGTVVNAMPRWIGAPRLVLGPDEIGHWRRLLWRGQGRANTHRMTMFDPAIVNLSNPDTTVPAAANAAQGATSVQLTITDPALVPAFGQILSADDWPMGVTGITDDGGNLYTIDVQPPLRAAITASDPVRLMGQGIFQLAADPVGSFAYDLFGKATPTLRFFEVLGR